MRTTTQDIERIISGEPLRLEAAYPLDDKEAGFTWFIKQPTDWLLDMAHAVRESAEAQILALPEMQAARELLPSDEWQQTQRAAIERTRARIAELQAIEARTPEDELELANTIEHETLLIQPEKYSRAQEIANKHGAKAFRSWLAPRLVVDAKGKTLCDPSTAEGRERWERLGSTVRSEIDLYVSHVLMMVRYAKNYSASKPSSTS